MLNNQDISTPRLQMVRLLLSDLKDNVNKKLIQVFNVLQDANKSKIDGATNASQNIWN